jgi:hypothetical protein
LNTGSAYDYLKRLTDLHRVHLFDVVMQYRAIFADDSSAAEDAVGSGRYCSPRHPRHREPLFLE